jgi:hypothetical protein
MLDSEISINGFKTIETAFQFIGDGSSNLIDMIAPNNIEGKKYILENILFLRLEYISDELSNSEVIIDDTKFTLGAYIQRDQKISVGRIELNANDFDGKFAPTKIIVGKNIKADVYYKTMEVTL